MQLIPLNVRFFFLKCSEAANALLCWYSIFVDIKNLQWNLKVFKIIFQHESATFQKSKCFYHIITLKQLSSQKLNWLPVLSAFYPQRHLVSVAGARSSGPRDTRRGLHRPSSCPRGCAAPRLCVGGTTACPGSTLSRTASRGPGRGRGAGQWLC